MYAPMSGTSVFRFGLRQGLEGSWNEVIVGVLAGFMPFVEGCRRMPCRGIPGISSRSLFESMLFLLGRGGTGELDPLTRSDQLPEEVRNIFRMFGRLTSFRGEGTLRGGDGALARWMESDEREVG